MNPQITVSEKREFLKNILVELVVYSVLVTGYFYLVLHFLGRLLLPLFEHERRAYAMVSILLMVGQGVFLESVTRSLLQFVRSRRK